MNWDFFTSETGGLIGFENHDHMTGDEYHEYYNEAHWDIDQGEEVFQGPTGPGSDNFLHWPQWTILSISTNVVDIYCQDIAP